MAAGDRDDAHAARANLVELGLLPVADEERHLVAAGAQLEGSIDHETLGSADAQTRTNEGDTQGRGHRGRQSTISRVTRLTRS
jgi:hypothetical protein